VKYLYVPPESFKRSPMVGVQRECTWSEFVDRFRKPRHGDRKDQFGAWCAGEFKDGIKREDHLLRCYALVVDIDEMGIVDTLVRIVGRTSAIVHETFSSNDAAPRCRVIFELARPCSPAEYRATWSYVTERLMLSGIVPDRACCDPGRLSYVPVRRPGSTYEVDYCEGRPIDAVSIARRHPLPTHAPIDVDGYRPRDLSRVQRAALEREADEVRATGPGQRHARALEAALRIFRPQLQIEYQDGERALLPAFLAATDGKRKGEGLRILRDAWRKNGR
jgi:hypothetical protein